MEIHDASTYFLVEPVSLAEVVRDIPAVDLGPVPVVVVVVQVVVVGPGPVHASDVPHEGLVGGPHAPVGQLPAPVTEVGEADPVTTEVGARFHLTEAAERVLEVRINLDRFKFREKFRFSKGEDLPGLSC